MYSLKLLLSILLSVVLFAKELDLISQQDSYHSSASYCYLNASQQFRVNKQSPSGSFKKVTMLIDEHGDSEVEMEIDYQYALNPIEDGKMTSLACKNQFDWVDCLIDQQGKAVVLSGNEDTAREDFAFSGTNCCLAATFERKYLVVSMNNNGQIKTLQKLFNESTWTSSTQTNLQIGDIGTLQQVRVPDESNFMISWSKENTKYIAEYSEVTRSFHLKNSLAAKGATFATIYDYAYIQPSLEFVTISICPETIPCSPLEMTWRIHSDTTTNLEFIKVAENVYFISVFSVSASYSPSTIKGWCAFIDTAGFAIRVYRHFDILSFGSAVSLSLTRPVLQISDSKFFWGINLMKGNGEHELRIFSDFLPTFDHITNYGQTDAPTIGPNTIDSSTLLWIEIGVPAGVIFLIMVAALSNAVSSILLYGDMMQLKID